MVKTSLHSAAKYDRAFYFFLAEYASNFTCFSWIMSCEASTLAAHSKSIEDGQNEEVICTLI